MCSAQSGEAIGDVMEEPATESSAEGEDTFDSSMKTEFFEALNYDSQESGSESQIDFREWTGWRKESTDVFVL